MSAPAATMVVVWFVVTQYGNAACADEPEANEIALIFRKRNEPVHLTTLELTPDEAEVVLANR